MAPCQVYLLPPSASLNKSYTSARDEWKKEADSLMLALDRAREAILSGAGEDDVAVRQVAAIAKSEQGKWGALRDVAQRFRTTTDEHRVGSDMKDVQEVHDRLVAEASSITSGAVNTSAIESQQVAHRKEDMKRLIKTFAESGNFELAAKVAQADPNKPLQPQIGFDPNDC